MIFKRLIDRINFSTNSSSNNNRNRLFNVPVANNDLLPVEEGSLLRINRNYSAGDFSLSEVCAIKSGPKKAKKCIDLESEIMSLENSRILHCHEHFNSFHDLNIDKKLHLHHDHNTRHLFRHMNHFSAILQQLNEMRKFELNLNILKLMSIAHIFKGIFCLYF